jgi:hypothetical protein
MSWFDKVLDAVQTLAVIGERVERLGKAVGDLAVDLRELDRRVARLKGVFAASGARDRSPESGPLPAPRPECFRTSAETSYLSLSLDAYVDKPAGAGVMGDGGGE